ncbi:MAG: caspase family protein [Nitrospiraceae bacterium]|nr:caspase family protein [Nitrospiraceae bacterium]
MNITSPFVFHVAKTFRFLTVNLIIGIFLLWPSLTTFAQDIQPRTLIGHTNEIFGLAFDATSHTVASASADQTIRLWDAQTGRLQKELHGHTATIRSLAFSPKGPWLASGASDKTTKVWDITTGKEVVSFSSVFGNIRAVAFSPDGEILASTGDGGSLRLLNWKEKKELKAMKSGFGITYAVAFSPSDTLIATGGSDTVVHLWNPSTGQQQTTLSGHTKSVLAVAFSPDGNLLASGSADGTIRLWEPRTGRERGTLSGHTGEVHAVGFTTNGSTIVSAGTDGTVRFWDSTTGKPLGTFTGHRGPVWALALSPNGSYLATGGRDRSIHLQASTPPKTESPRITTGPIIPRDADVGPPPVPPPHAEADFFIQPHQLKAGDALTVHLQVANTGKGPLYRFSAKTTSPLSLLQDKHFYFGKILPGQSKSETLQLTIPPDFTDDTIPVEVQFDEYNGFTPDPLKALITLAGSPRPRLAYNYQIIDNGTGQSVGNGDGRIQKGEAVDLLLTVKNVGSVPAQNTWVELSNEEGQHLEIRPHMIRFGQLAPNETKQTRLSFTVWPDYPQETLNFGLFIQEKTLKVFLNEKLDLAVDTQPPQQILATNKIVQVSQDQVSVLSGAGVDTSVLAMVGNKQSLFVTGELGDWYRVQLSEKEIGWVAKHQVSATISTAADRIPIPTIQDLEANKAAQFITLSEQLEKAQEERAQIEETLQQRELDMLTLQAKLEQMKSSQQSTLFATREQLDKERAEREQTERILRQREEEAKQLRTQLENTAETKSSELSTMKEHLQQEQHQREQAETALQNFKQELNELRSKLEEMNHTRSQTKTPPAIALATPFEGQTLKVDRVQLVGAAASDRGIARLEFRVNEELLARRQGRGIAVTSSQDVRQATLEFSESVPLKEGENVITVVAYDGDQLTSTRTLHVMREVNKGNIWAVVIGISQYERVRPLKYADQDALAFHQYLTQNIGVPDDHVTLLLNEKATLYNLKRSLGTHLKRNAGAHDTVIIYYAGHGAPEADAFNADGDGLEKYLVPYDADSQDLYTTGLPMREVETIFQRLSAERVIFITDSCYSGATAGRTFATVSRRANLSDGFLNRLSKGKGRVVLTASRAGEVSEERDELGHGVFTYYLLEGLRGKADIDGDKIVTVDEIYSYLSEQVPAVTGQNQHPVKKGEVEGQLILGRIQ